MGKYSHRNTMNEVRGQFWSLITPTSCPEQYQLEQVVLEYDQLYLAFFQGCRVCNLSVQPTPVFDHPHSD